MYQIGFLNTYRSFSMSVPEAAVCRSSVRIWDAIGLVIPNSELKFLLNSRGVAYIGGDGTGPKRRDNQDT